MDRQPPRSDGASPRPGPGADRPGTLFSPVAVGRVSTLIVEQIRVLIRDGRLGAGDRLPSERELGERFGVSRVTVREALRALEASGLITIRVGARGGAFVTAPTGDQLGENLSDLVTLAVLTPAEVTEARQIFELGLVPLVCERATATDLAELTALCDEAEAGVDATHPYNPELSAAFHIRVAAATHNKAIEMFAQSFHGPLLMSLLRAQQEDPQMGVRGRAEHRDFVEAVARGDVTGATRTMSEHLARTAARLRPHPPAD